MAGQFVPFARPAIGEAEIEEVVSVLRSGWLTSGPRVAQFEEDFRAYTGARYALAVNSATAGLHLALAALGIGAGDEVITTPMTFCATVNVILQVGARPVLVDIGPDMNIDTRCIERALTRRTKAILPVHIAGLPCDMGKIWQIAERHNLAVVEDAAHASGASYQGAKIGSGKSTAVVFSFYANKNMTTGEGGMVLTHSAELNDRMRILCLHGISRDAWNRYSEAGKWFYEVVDCGFKYNMPDTAAAIGIHQLRKLDAMNARRAAVALAYNAAFRNMPELQLPAGERAAGHAWHLYVLRLNLSWLSIGRDRFIQKLRERGIGCSVHFIPIPLHPAYKDNVAMPAGCSNAMAEYQRCLSLPLDATISDKEVQQVIRAVKDVVAEFPAVEVFASREVAAVS
jgi:dTDP-4-amino-4,6-dideoxygalactose transaminase